MKQVAEYKDSARMLQLVSKTSTTSKENKYKSQVKSVYRTPSMSPAKHKFSKCTSKGTSSLTVNMSWAGNKCAMVLDKNARTIRTGKEQV